MCGGLVERGPASLPRTETESRVGRQAGGGSRVGRQVRLEETCGWRRRLFYVLTYVSQYVVTGGKAGEGAVSVGRQVR